MFQTRNIILNLVSHIAYTLCSMHPQLTSLLKLQLQNLILKEVCHKECMAIHHIRCCLWPKQWTANHGIKFGLTHCKNNSNLQILVSLYNLFAGFYSATHANLHPSIDHYCILIALFYTFSYKNWFNHTYFLDVVKIKSY